MINVLRATNEKKLREYINKDQITEVLKHTAIQQILKDENCFFKISVEQARDILQSLNVKNWKTAYIDLLSK